MTDWAKMEPFKRDMQGCYNCKGIKLTSRTLRLIGRVGEVRLRGKVAISEHQCGYIPGKKAR